MAEENDQPTDGSPRYVDETVGTDPNLRPDLAETEERGTDKEPDVEE